MSKPKQLSWKPRRRGKIYCAPACGRGCTHKEFTAANANAKELCRKLNATTHLLWKPNVWENLGWHYSAISSCGRIKVHNGYVAFLGDPDSSGGTWAETMRTPAGAVRAVIATAKLELKKIGAILQGLDA